MVWRRLVQGPKHKFPKTREGLVMKMTARFVCVLVLLFSVVAVASADNEIDGNWWRTHSSETHIAFVIGFFQGMTLGRTFSVWRMLEQTDKEALNNATQSYDYAWDKFVQGTTVGQVTEGLESFYADARNRKIGVGDAVWLVLNSIAGTPNVEKMIEDWRQKPGAPDK